MPNVYIVFVNFIKDRHMPVSIRSDSTMAIKDCYKLINALCPDGLYFNQDEISFFKGRREDSRMPRTADTYWWEMEIDDETELNNMCQRMKNWKV